MQQSSYCWHQIHYDPSLPLKLATDASQYGLGAVISHMLLSGEEKPIAFASRSLSKNEKNYSQIDKEALSLIYGIQKFHTYLYGRKFMLVTDHKPLTSILGPKKGVPSVAAACLQRWALWQHTIITSNSNRPLNTEMQMRCHDCHCLETIQVTHRRLVCITSIRLKVYQ